MVRQPDEWEIRCTCGTSRRSDAAANALWCSGNADSVCAVVFRRAQVEEAGALAALFGRAVEAESWDAAGLSVSCSVTRRSGRRWWSRRGRLVATASFQVVLTFRSVVGCVGLRQI